MTLQLSMELDCVSPVHPGGCGLKRFDPKPLGQIDITFPVLDGKTICRIDVRLDKNPHHLDDKVYVRDGNATLELTGPATTAWLAKRLTT